MRSTDTFPSLCVNEAGYGRERSGPDLPFSPRALSSRGRRTPQTIKHVASRGRAAGLLLVREVFTLVGYCWSLFRAIICRSEQSIQPRQLQPPLVRTSLECLCMSRRAQSGHQLTHPHTHIQTDIFKLMHRITQSHMYMHSHTRHVYGQGYTALHGAYTDVKTQKTQIYLHIFTQKYQSLWRNNLI